MSADIRALRHSIREVRDRNWEHRQVIDELTESLVQARIAARETAEILRLQEDRFQQLLTRFEGLAQVVSLADSRDLGFDQLRESVRTLTQTQQAQEDDLDTFLERVHDLEVSRDQLLGRVQQLEGENRALLRYTASLHIATHTRQQQFDVAFRSLWIRYLNLLATTRNSLEASEAFLANLQTSGTGQGLPLAQSLLHAARQSAPDESQPIATTNIGDSGNPYIGADLVLPPAGIRTSEIILPATAGHILHTLHRAGVSLRGTFAARLPALRAQPSTFDVDSSSDSDSQDRLDRLFNAI